MNRVALALGAGLLLLGAVFVVGLKPGLFDGPAGLGTSPRPVFMEGTPGAALDYYLAADFAGERLERATWMKFKALVAWPREPVWDSAIVTRSYRIATGKTTRVRADAEVTFENLGDLDLTTFAYTPSAAQQRVPYQLEAIDNLWKVSLPTLRPHPSAEGTTAFLVRMRAGFPKLAATIDQSIAAIQADAAKPAL